MVTTTCLLILTLCDLIQNRLHKERVSLYRTETPKYSRTKYALKGGHVTSCTNRTDNERLVT